MVDYAPLDYFRQDEADAVLAALLLMGLHQEGTIGSAAKSDDTYFPRWKFRAQVG